jgi:hypothetical protein
VVKIQDNSTKEVLIAKKVSPATKPTSKSRSKSHSKLDTPKKRTMLKVKYNPKARNNQSKARSDFILVSKEGGTYQKVTDQLLLSPDIMRWNLN